MCKYTFSILANIVHMYGSVPVLGSMHVYSNANTVATSSTEERDYL